jgi:hypothetical protein
MHAPPFVLPAESLCVSLIICGYVNKNEDGVALSSSTEKKMPGERNYEAQELG